MTVPLATPARIVSELASHGYNADREAVTLLAGAPDTGRALARAIEATPEDALTISTEQVRAVLDDGTPDDHRTPRTDHDSTPDHDSETDTPSTPRDAASSDDHADRDATPSTHTGDSRAANSSELDDDASADSADHLSEESSTPAATNSREDRSGAKSTSTEDDPSPRDPPVSSGTPSTPSEHDRSVPLETKGSSSERSVETPARSEATGSGSESATDDSRESISGANSTAFERSGDDEARDLEITGDMTGHSTGTGTYADFVTTFRDRYERLSGHLRSRVNHRPTEAVHAMAGGSDAAMIGMISDIRSTANGHWLVELEDTTGTFPCLILKDRDLAGLVDELLLDEVIAVEGSLAGDGGILFVDDLHFPDVPRTYTPSTADRHVRAALISDIHVGSQEFRADAWERFADWLHTEEAAAVEYLLIAGDMVEGVGVYPGQDEELDIIDLYGQYERFAELLKLVPGDLDIVMIPGNHDAVRLAEPQPGFDEELRDIMSAHDARITSNPSTVTLEGVTFLLYHGVSLDEVIAELPEEKASYDNPHHAMNHLLKKRHVAPQYGGHTRLAPEDRDYLVMEEVPDVFHTGHVHKLGYGKYHDVLSVNSACWQDQTSFQESVNIQPDVGYAPIVDLDTLDLTIQKF